MEIEYIKNKFNAMNHIAFCRPAIEEIHMLMNLQINGDRKAISQTCSRIIMEHEREFNQIAIFLTDKKVVHGDMEKIYSEEAKKETDLAFDIDYIIDCLVIIYAVKYGLEESIEKAIKNIKREFE